MKKQKKQYSLRLPVEMKPYIRYLAREMGVRPSGVIIKCLHYLEELILAEKSGKIEE